MSLPTNLFWDSCVFIRWLTASPAELVSDIEQFIADARRKEIRIHFSTIAYAEIRPSFLKQPHKGSITRLFSELGSSFFAIDPNPNIMITAGQMKDAHSTNPSDPKIGEDKKRVIGTADAIQLATCLYARDVLELSDIVFHTFDDGKTRGAEGRCVPLLSFERWFPEPARIGRIAEVCSLTRQHPCHPTPDLATRGKTDARPRSESRH